MIEIAAVVLAAGNSRRFGRADKLEQKLGGEPLAFHIADTLKPLGLRWRIAVCRGVGGRVPEGFVQRGFEIVVNPDAGRGLGSSLALGAARARGLGAGGVLVALADMPLITVDHLRRLVARFDDDPASAVASAGGSYRGPPALFPARLFGALGTLTGDSGARPLLAGAATVEADEAQFRDFDLPADFT